MYDTAIAANDNKLIKFNFHINDKWALKEFTKKAQFHHYVGAWYMAGKVPDIWYNDKHAQEDPTVIAGDAEGKFLYKVIRINNFSEYLEAIGRPKTTNYAFERDIIKSLCVVPKEPIRYQLKTKDGRPYTSECYGESIMRYRLDKYDSDGSVFYDQIELGGWEGIVDCAWSAVSASCAAQLIMTESSRIIG